jgi:hypothetical protein
MCWKQWHEILTETGLTFLLLAGAWLFYHALHRLIGSCQPTSHRLASCLFVRPCLVFFPKILHPIISDIWHMHGVLNVD